MSFLYENRPTAPDNAAFQKTDRRLGPCTARRNRAASFTQQRQKYCK